MFEPKPTIVEDSQIAMLEQQQKMAELKLAAWRVVRLWRIGSLADPDGGSVSIDRLVNALVEAG